jgi:hypothetical protein
VHSRSVVKISYNIKMTTQKIRSHDDRRSTTWICSSSPTMIYSIVHIYRSLHSVSDYSTSITLPMMKSRKKKMFSPIHISTDEQISIHFGKASIQDERTCTLKLELVEITLLTRREDSPSQKKVRKHLFL